MVDDDVQYGVNIVSLSVLSSGSAFTQGSELFYLRTSIVDWKKKILIFFLFRQGQIHIKTSVWRLSMLSWQKRYNAIGADIRE